MLKDMYNGIEVKWHPAFDNNTPVIIYHRERRMFFANSPMLYKLYLMRADIQGEFDKSIKMCFDHARQKLHERIDAISK